MQLNAPRTKTFLTGFFKYDYKLSMNSMLKKTSFWLLIAVYAFSVTGLNAAHAQKKSEFQENGVLESGLVDTLGDPIQEPNEKVSLRAEFTVDESGKTGTLRIIADVIPNWHIFSVTQPDGGSIRTQIRMQSGFDQATITGFVARINFTDFAGANDKAPAAVEFMLEKLERIGALVGDVDGSRRSAAAPRRRGWRGSRRPP